MLVWQIRTLSHLHLCHVSTTFCESASMQIGFCAILQFRCVASIHQPVDELSEGLIWASREGCLEDVVFLLTTGVEVNSRGQVRLRMSLSGGMSNGAIFIPYLHCYSGSLGITLELPHPSASLWQSIPGPPV